MPTEDFFPLRTSLRLDNHSYSPTVRKMVAEAMGQLRSAEQATFALKLAKIPISSRHVQRLAQEIGNEMAHQRDDQVIQQRRRELPVRVSATPEVVAVEVDGGRLRTRAQGCGPGVHEVQGKEEKVAALMTLKSPTFEHDPQSEPPPSFLQPRRVRRLVTQMKGLAGRTRRIVRKTHRIFRNTQSKKRNRRPNRHRLNRLRRRRRWTTPVVPSDWCTCVASMSCSDQFGPMMAAEAQERDFYRAPRKAFVGDGAEYNWSIHRGYFADFEPITDFLHALCYVYLAAWAESDTEAQQWSLYETWLRACWQGRVSDVIAELEGVQQRVGMPPDGEELDKKDPRRLVSEALSYLGNNQRRMDYPRYRREGLPITSSWVESLVGDFNARVKSRQQFWNRPKGPEPILQRAAVLSEDERLDRFFAQRPGNPRRGRKAA
ncbi:hypothetical protein FTUN_4545 [Frigoriglobus tundricola]|uniref:Uncharacterized protein n=2 Tax=Frigoriglobus tundricola TaxID=2774151 RepID=A0A6M5YSF5_9BACT|nr:hypothetical protein FTUN_4545 [Frigoriglobus tundricola]